MKILSQNLSGKALDFAVGKIDQPLWHDHEIVIFVTSQDQTRYSPSTIRHQGYRILEVQGIDVSAVRNAAGVIVAWRAHLDLQHVSGDLDIIEARGPDALTAAMRCLVQSRFGDEVEIPDELLP